ncbi:peptidylprolyl isomerase [Paenibacillus flagellatus]|uniref:Peptidylprolyl isomerase n=1 Tax=Paenibacillus flagellatus TaxID=2211139 RepID=A0A2V5JYK0_9BACL|nr:peptidylprolyl isomerase [Paenibacillus flagellatus]PYI50223.1 peptidylprolyl isomerase [Paenibacillus flagellatus]
MLPINRSKTARRASAAIAAFVVASVIVTGCGKDKNNAGAATDTSNPDVVATYKEGGQVTRGEYDKFVGAIKFFNPMYAQFETDPSFQEHMVKQLIAFKVLGAKADEPSKKDAETKATEQVDQIKQYFEQQGGDKNALDTQLKTVNITQDDLKNYVRQSLVVLNDAEKKVTDDQVKAKYDENAKANAYTIATVSHILVSLKDENQEKEIRTKEEALARAKEVKQKLDAGGDFAELAKQYSDDGGSKNNGGKYENAEVGQWLEGFKKAAIELPIGQISEPVETEYGYHIMKVEARKTKTLDEVKDQIKSEQAEAQVMDFIDKELPGLIEKIDTAKLPQPAPAPATPNTGTGTGTTTPAPSGTDQQQPAQQQPATTTK